VNGDLAYCWACSRLDRGRRPAVAIWSHGLTPYFDPLCQGCLDMWFDNADDDPDMEPWHVRWLDGSRELVGVA
jgi:hypothetical protein